MVRSLNGSKSVVGRSPNILTTKVFSNGDIANAFNVQYTCSKSPTVVIKLSQQP